MSDRKDKDSAIDFLMNDLVDNMMKLPFNPKVNFRYAIAACLRFATRAALRMHLSIEELKKQLEEEWMWNEAKIKSKDSISKNPISKVLN